MKIHENSRTSSPPRGAPPPPPRAPRRTRRPRRPARRRARRRRTTGRPSPTAGPRAGTGESKCMHPPHSTLLTFNFLPSPFTFCRFYLMVTKIVFHHPLPTSRFPPFTFNLSLFTFTFDLSALCILIPSYPHTILRPFFEIKLP